MEDLTQWLFPGTTINTILAIRPVSITIFEKLGVDPFAMPSERIGKACAGKGVSWEAFLSEIRGLREPAPATADPIFLPSLLDRLTADHQQFLRAYFPAINDTFVRKESRPFSERMHSFFQVWPDFMADLKDHIATEEEFLFPKILRYDYCLRHGKADPEFSSGSIKVFVAVHLLKNEEKRSGVIRNFLEDPRFSALAEKAGNADEQSLNGLLGAFRDALLEHSRVEKEVLFPLAGSLEKALYDRSISGLSSQRSVSIP